MIVKVTGYTNLISRKS